MNDFLGKTDTLKSDLDSHRKSSKNNTFTQFKDYYRVSLTYTSNAIEGNSLTEEEVKITIEQGIPTERRSLQKHY